VRVSVVHQKSHSCQFEARSLGREMFAEEKPALSPPPLEPFRYYEYGQRVVHLDGCVEIAAAYYSAPPRWIGRTVQVQWNLQYVRVLDPLTGQLLREHLRERRGRHRIHDADRPQRTPLSAANGLAPVSVERLRPLPRQPHGIPAIHYAFHCGSVGVWLRTCSVAFWT